MSRTNAPVRASTARRGPPPRLHERWARLHRTDREPWPEERLLGRLGAGHPHLASWIDAHGGAAAVARVLQEAWQEFHAGDFVRAVRLGGALGALGAAVANKAAAVDSLYSRRSAAATLSALESAIERGERAVGELPEHANTHYTLALVLGRYSQRISIAAALAKGLAGRVRTHLERALALEPRHAEAHLAFGLFHAEILAKLGALAAGLAYGASQREALEHFRRANALAPDSPIVHMEFAHGLMLLDAARYRAQAQALYRDAAACKPADEMERLDIERAKAGLP